MQLEFYFDKLKWAHPEAWRKVSSTYAEGEKWPSVNELRESLLAMNRYYVTAIAHRQEDDLVPMPEELRARLVTMGLLKDLSMDVERNGHA